MIEKVALCALFVCFQGIIENLLEVGGRSGGIMVRVRHEGVRALSGRWLELFAERRNTASVLDMEYRRAGQLDTAGVHSSQ
jgi:hypothetical protein